MFDITSVLDGIASSKAGAGKPELREIPLHLIDRNPQNFYSTDGIDALADNIRMFGLMEPLIVRETTDGRYLLISGHRRRLALRKIAEEAENFPESMHEKVACLVQPEGTPLPGIEGGEETEAKARQMAEELRLIFANSDTRVMSSADTAQQVRRIRELLAGLRDLGYQLPGKLRDHVAAAAKVSATRVARLDVIDKGLTEPALRKAWKDGTLGETSAYEIARRPADVQKLAAQRVGPKVLADMTTDRVIACLEACEADGNREREAVEDWNRNVGNIAKATKAAEPEKIVKSGFSADEYLKQRRREDDTFAERLDELFDMFVKDLDYVTDRREGIEFLKRKHGTDHHGGSTETGFFDCSLKGLTLADDDYEYAITRTWTEVFDELSLGALRMVARGKVSTADTVIRWSTGTPAKPGEYVIVCGAPKEKTPGSWIKLIQRWTGDGWTDSKGVPLRLTVYEWIRLPEI